MLTGLVSSFSAAPDASTRDRTLKLYFPHTGERGAFTYKRNGRYDRNELKKINRFLRDWRRNEAIDMDPALLDLVWEVHRLSGAREPIHIISAYRSPTTNETLRKRGRGVAKNSQHTRGKAMDFFIPGVPLSKLREIGLKTQAGGVGFYPTSGSPFVHLDTGSVRHWPRMTRKQLMAVFPTGETVHVPTDGKPLPGYKLAKAKVDGSRRSATVVASLAPASRPSAARTRAPASATGSPGDDGPTRNWLSRVFGTDTDEGVEEDDGLVAGPGSPTELVDARQFAADEMPLPRGRPETPAPAAAPVVVASLEGLPRPRPVFTPFDITPEERARTAALAAVPPVGGEVGSRRTDDALAGLYTTASYDPGEDPVRRAREQLARMAAAEKRARAAPVEDVPSAAVDDALSDLFATADGTVKPEPAVVVVASATSPDQPGPETGAAANPLGPAIAIRASKGDLIWTAAPEPPRQVSALAAARQNGYAMFRSQDDESPPARASQQGTFVEVEPGTALAAANSFSRRNDTKAVRDRARQSLIRLAYADTTQAGPAQEPEATGSVLDVARPRTVPRVAPVETGSPLVAAGLAQDGTGPPLPRARPGSRIDAPTIVANLSRDAVDPVTPAPQWDREVPVVAPPPADTAVTGDGPRFIPTSGARGDIDLLAEKIEQEADWPDGYPWSDDSRKLADLAERMTAGDTQFQARDIAELRRPAASGMQPLFAPIPETRPVTDGGWQTQTASLDILRFKPLPHPADDVPTPRDRPERRAGSALQERGGGAFARLIQTARTLTGL